MATTPLDPQTAHSRAPRAKRGQRGRKGFTMVELMLTATIAGILMMISASGMRTLNKQQRNERLARAVLWEVTVARSYALRSGISMALVANEATRTLTLRDRYGVVYRTQRFGPGTDFGASALDIGTTGDSLAFSSRGICLNCDGSGATTIQMTTAGRSSSMTIGVLGRAELVGFSRN